MCVSPPFLLKPFFLPVFFPRQLTVFQVPKQNKEIIGGKYKNKESSGMGHSMGRVHMQKQDLNTMNLMKFKVPPSVICIPFFAAAA